MGDINKPADCSVTLFDLPPHVLVAALGCLEDARDLVSVSSACRALQTLVASNIWPGVRRLRLDTYHASNDAAIAWVAVHCPELSEFQAAYGSRLGDQVLAKLHGLPLRRVELSQPVDSPECLPLSEALQVLDLRGSTVSFDASLAAAFPPEVRLKELYLTGDILDPVAYEVLERWPGLHTLVLPGPGVVAADMLRSLPRLAPRLTTLSLAGRSELPELRDALSGLPSLREGDFSGTDVEDASLEGLAACSGLQRLALCGCLAFKGHCLEALASASFLQAGCLTSLQLAENGRVPGMRFLRFFRQWAAHSRPEHQVELNLTDCGGLDDACLRALLKPGCNSSETSSTGRHPPAFMGPRDIGSCSHSLPFVAQSLPSAAESPEVSRGPEGMGRLSLSETAPAEVPEALSSTASDTASQSGSLELQIAISEVETAAAQNTPSSDRPRVGDGGEQDAGLETGRLEEQQHVLLQGLSFAELRLSGCSRLTSAALGELLESQVLERVRVLDLRNLEAIRQPPQQAPLPQLLSAARPTLRELYLDGAMLSDGILAEIGRRCRQLRALGLIGCKGFTDAGLQAVGSGCRELRDLAVGGTWPKWSEARGLAAFTQLEALHVARRNSLLDVDLAAIAAALPDLRSVTIAACGEVTDKGLAELSPQLRHLKLVCCDRVRGGGLTRFRALESLRLPGCRAVTAEAVQRAVVACRRLRVIELPIQLPASCLPVGAGHLAALRVEGGEVRVPHFSAGLRRRLRASMS